MGRVLAVVGAATLLAFAAACGDGGGGDAEPTLGPPLSLEEYFSDVAALDTAFAERSGALDAQLAEDRAEIASAEDALNVARDHVGASVFSLQQFVRGLQPLSPPAEAEDAHRDAVASGERTMDAFNALPEQYETLSSAEDLDALLADSALETASAALRQACADLQAAADDNRIDIALHCGV